MGDGMAVCDECLRLEHVPDRKECDRCGQVMTRNNPYAGCRHEEDRGFLSWLFGKKKR